MHARLGELIADREVREARRAAETAEEAAMGTRHEDGAPLCVMPLDCWRGPDLHALVLPGESPLPCPDPALVPSGDGEHHEKTEGS
jgi:hypothetical protein